MTEATTEETTTEPELTNEEKGNLGDPGQKALVAERKRVETLTKELNLLRAAQEAAANAELTELERFKKENEALRGDQTAAELKAIRLQVALEKGIPANLAARLQGDDYDSIAADADSLSELVTTRSPSPRSDPSQGSRNTGGARTPAQDLADAITNARGR